MASVQHKKLVDCTDRIKITLNDKIKEYSELKEEYLKGLING